MRWERRILAALAWIYPISLLSFASMLRFVGEGWWVTGVGLYLPRLALAVPLPLIIVALAVTRMHRSLWSQAAALLLLVFPLMGFVLPWPTLPTRDAPTLRVLSYNANSGYGGVGNIVDEIDRYSPDVVFLQEMGPTEAISTLLGARYLTVSVVNQFVLASRYPILSTTDPEKIDYGGRSRSARFVQHVLDTPLGRISFFNVHPGSPREAFQAIRGRGLRREFVSGRLFSAASSTAFEANSGLRSLQVRAFSEAARRESDPVVIAGDTNLPGLSLVFHRYLSEYQDGFTKAGWGFGYTFPTNRRPWMRIDRVLASGELRFVRFAVGSSLASDHFCVVADLQLRGR